MISVIIPTLNAAEALKRSLPPLVPGVAAGLVREVIVSDAGSQDATLAIADAAGATVVRSALGEGAQSIAGALSSRGDWLLFLHARSALEPHWVEEARRFVEGPARAGVFRYGVEAEGAKARLAEFWADVRTGLFKRPRREQGLLIARALYERVGGFTAAAGARKDLLERIGAIRMLRVRAVV
jgi:glycosyltransferase involved in cell wall biosynthesis